MLSKPKSVRRPRFTRPYLALVLLSTHPAVADTVYNNIAYNVSSIYYASDFGNSVTLAGTARSVTSISVGIVGDGGGNQNMEMELWTAGGPGGTPGTLLWQSGYQSFPIVDQTFQTISFNVPLVKVPETLIWDLSCQSGSLEGPSPGTTVVGTTGPGWTYLLQPPPFPFAAGPFMADIEATVPEPSLASILALGILQTFLGKWRRRCQ